MAEEISRETQSSIAASSMFPGFRFSPTDVELISYYLKKKMEGLDKCMEVIAQIEFCKYEPWDLLGTSEGDKAIESHLKKCSSSHDSYSLEQIESASESEERLAYGANLTGSSAHNKISVTKKITLPRY
ncbi:hypothetical protein LWI28_024237 [Acer negundo]|uniref:NAC domain-containing protein n=1 Tax=Acer negundo TaxID=4023 RepID=A0AAD5P425_ACENE|nr:hypothetical protein LWI28_024237 [Acer negundo]